MYVLFPLYMWFLLQSIANSVSKVLSFLTMMLWNQAQKKK